MMVLHPNFRRFKPIIPVYLYSSHNIGSNCPGHVHLYVKLMIFWQVILASWIVSLCMSEIEFMPHSLSWPAQSLTKLAHQHTLFVSDLTRWQCDGIYSHSHNFKLFWTTISYWCPWISSYHKTIAFHLYRVGPSDKTG